MTRLDHFQSAFLSAAKTTFTYEEIKISSVMVVTDLSEYEARLFGDRVRGFLSVLGDDVQWEDLPGEQCDGVNELLRRVEEDRPDLICTYRHLHSGDWEWPYGLGGHLDVLTQVTTTPVLVLPRPDDTASFEKIADTDMVMAMTSMLPGDHRLVNAAVCFTEPGGTLFTTHIEKRSIFDRYMDAISKIPTIDTEPAREEIAKQLLKEARYYIDSCRDELVAKKIPITIEEIVTLGHHLADYKQLITEHEVDLLVINTKDDDQMAMHGLAYPLAVELRTLPLLML